MTPRALTGAALLTVAACVLVAAAPVEAAKKPLPESNLALLDRTLAAAARQLVEGAPLAPGSKVALVKAEDAPLALGVERALLAALTERRIEVWLAPASAVAESATAVRADTAWRRGPVTAETLAELRARQQALSTPAKPQEIFDPGTGAAPLGGAPAPPPEIDRLPLLTVRAEEARVDYPRLYRSGLFGGLHVERRALSRLSARLLRPESRAVYWVAAADTAIADHVAKSEVKMLEDPARAETRGTVPSQSWQKFVEPILVVALMVGLVSLFYTNRP
jgi:hypothetical protein